MMSLRHHTHPSSLIIGNQLLNLVHPLNRRYPGDGISFCHFIRISHNHREWHHRTADMACQFRVSSVSHSEPKYDVCATGLFLVHLPAHPAILVDKSVLESRAPVLDLLSLIVADVQVSSGGVTGQPALYLTDVNEDVLRRCHENTQLPCSRFVVCVVEAQLSYSRRISPSRKFICQIARLV